VTLINRVHRQPFTGHSQRYLAERATRVRAIRDPMIQALYATKEWRTLRVQCLTNALGICAVNRCMRRAVVADHIKPHRGDAGLFFDLANLQALCKRCHDRKTARYDGGFGRVRKTAPEQSPAVRALPRRGARLQGESRSGGVQKFPDPSPRSATFSRLAAFPFQKNVMGAKVASVDDRSAGASDPARGPVRAARITADTSAKPFRHAPARRVHVPSNRSARGQSGR